MSVEMSAAQEGRRDVSARVRRRPSGEPPPLPRQSNRAGNLFLSGLVVAIVVWIAVIYFDSPRSWITERDLDFMRPMIDSRPAWVATLAQAVQDAGLDWAVPVVGWPIVVAVSIGRRWRHLAVFLVSLVVVTGGAEGISLLIERPRPFGVEALGRWHGFAHPAVPIAAVTATLVAGVVVAVPPGVWRRTLQALTALVLVVLGGADVYLGVSHPTDVLLALAIGGAVPTILLRLFVPESAFPVTYGRDRIAHLDVGGERGRAIRKAVAEQVGLEVTDVERVGLGGSAGSTPIRLTVAGEPEYHLFGKIYARSHLRSDRWYKLGRELRYGRLEDEARFTSVRRLAQHEDYLLHLFEAHGVAAPEPHALLELTPEREYLLLMEQLDGAMELGDADVDEAVIDGALATVKAMWGGGLAHRDIKPANVMVQRGRVHLVDLAFAQVQPSPWRQAVDLANMMLILALRTSPQLVYERAQRQFTREELGEALAAARGITIPQQLRTALREDGRPILAELRELAGTEVSVGVQRWSVRRLALTVWTLAAAAVGGWVVVANLDTVGLL